MKVKISPFSASGEIVAPPSKSVAHRLIISALLKKGKTLIKNVGSSADVLATLSCVKNLGANVIKTADGVLIEGVTKPLKGAVLDCNESGSTLRFLMPVASALGADALFTGSERLMARPSDALISVLEMHGIKRDGNRLVGKLTSGKFEIDSSISSQYVTGLLLALPILDGDSQIVLKGETVSKDYIEITLSVLEKCGIEYKKSGYNIFIKGNQEYNLPDEIAVEGDWSGAAFPLVLGAINGCVTVAGLDTNSKQGDREILEIIKKAGAMVKVDGDKVTVSTSELVAFKQNFENIPDLAPICAVLASVANGESRFSGIERLKIKESDRVLTTLAILKVAGIFAKEENGEIVINGGKIQGGIYDGANDHRIVMSEAVISSVASGDSVIIGSGAIAKSYPEFFEHLRLLGGKINGDI